MRLCEYRSSVLWDGNGIGEARAGNTVHGAPPGPAAHMTHMQGVGGPGPGPDPYPTPSRPSQSKTETIKHVFLKIPITAPCCETCELCVNTLG